MRGSAPILLLLLAACASTPLEQRAWLEVRSPNFTLYSDLPQAQAVALTEDLEIFRSVAGKLMGASRLDPRVPTRIVAFAHAQEVAPFAPTVRAAGFFRSGLRENQVVLGAIPSQRIDPRVLLFHEYTHFLLRNQNAFVYPVWYDEGFAEFMGTLRVDPEAVFVGAAPTYRRWTAQQGDAHDLETVIRADSFHEGWDPDQISMFYLQSWQLVHYFMLGPGKERKPGLALARYLRSLEQGEDEGDAFAAAFGMDFNALWRELSDYNRQRKLPALSIPRRRLEPAPVQEVRAVPPAEIAVQLGFLALHASQPDLAEAYFTRALIADPVRSRAHAGIGVVKQLRGPGEAPRPHFERALELAPDDFENHLELAEWLHQRADREKRADLLPEARRHYQRAVELAPGIPEAHAMLGASYLLTDEDPARGIALLEHARNLLPGEISLLLPLARLYARAGRPDDARAAARRAACWSHGRAREEADEVLAEIEAWSSSPAGP